MSKIIALPVKDDSQKTALNKLIKAVITEVKTPQQSKDSAIAALLANIEPVDLTEVCESLGWTSDTKGNPPAQKHIKVAIVDTLIKTAKKNNWHIIHDLGFFYIFNGAFWVVLLDSEVKQLLKDAAVKMGYIEIECRDALFVDKLFQQATQDGFFVEKNYTKQSIINLKNGSLVLSDAGIKMKPFDYRDFLTHQLDFAYNPAAINTVFLNMFCLIKIRGAPCRR